MSAKMEVPTVLSTSTTEYHLKLLSGLDVFFERHCIGHPSVSFSVSVRCGYSKNIFCILPLYFPFRPSLCLFNTLSFNLWLFGLLFPEKPAKAFVFKVLGRSHFTIMILRLFISIFDCNREGAKSLDSGYSCISDKISSSQNLFRWAERSTFPAREEPAKNSFLFFSPHHFCAQIFHCTEIK